LGGVLACEHRIYEPMSFIRKYLNPKIFMIS